MAAAYSKAITTPCATEDSTTCYWDAASFGDGNGRSFIDVLGTAYYH